MLTRLWYGASPLATLPLWPLAGLYGVAVGGRRLAYRAGLRRARRLKAPVIVVGNLTVGGTGKTPLVIWLCEHLRRHGWRPGVVARGYRGRARHWPQQVRSDSDPVMVGDEAVLVARRTGCPVCVGPDRVAAGEALLAHTDADIVVSDDGLQHLALARDLEILVMDGERGLGNRLLLPAGPLREPASRREGVDLVVATGKPQPGAHLMRLGRPRLVPLGAEEAGSTPLDRLAGREVHALAGIGHPERFFALLESHGLKVMPHPLPDHHHYHARDLDFGDDRPVVMTEKDAVKCRRWGRPGLWAVAVDAEPAPAFVEALDQRLEALRKIEGWV